jgi:transmembrane sensor
MLNKKEFESIIQRYLSGQSTPEEERMVDRWYANITETEDKLSFLEKIVLRKKIKGKLRASRQVSRPARVINFFPFDLESLLRRPGVSLAFAFGLIAVVAIFFFRNFPGSSPDETKQFSNILESVTNDGSSIRSVQLTDGSVVSLQPGATLEIGSFTDDMREVFLKKGEAFFDIQRDEKRPFIVYANEIVTRVLGTSFSIQTEKSDVTVSVKTGRVSVSKQADPYHRQGELAEVVLTANQKAVFDSRENKLSKALVEKPQIIVPAEELSLMSFEEAAVSTILEAVEKAYGVDIEFNQSKLSSCTLTTYLNKNENLYDRLEIICSAIGATYAVEGTRVNIHSPGCGEEVNDPQHSN